MHTLEKSLREDTFRKNPKNPSFSSTLLDEIYRSIDKKEAEKNSCNGVREKINNPVEEDEEMGSLSRRVCLIDKWMEKKVNGRREMPFLSDFEKDSPLQDNDPLFFSSSSISSDSSSGSGGFYSSSDTEFFSAAAAAKTKTRTSCFASSWPKPIKTKIVLEKKQNAVVSERTNQEQKDGLIKSRSRAVKIYTNLKNLKQPISPGGRLTSFINSLFKNGDESVKKEGKCKSNQTSACSSATSFSRSCLSKTPSTSTSTSRTNNAKRAVSFYQCSEEMKAYKKKDDFVVKRSVLEDEDEDAASDCSSDLFEIDHLVLFESSKRFCEELPVYETTYLDNNLAIASGLVR